MITALTIMTYCKAMSYKQEKEENDNFLLSLIILFSLIFALASDFAISNYLINL